jgi:D-serine deaminase-like pyridoxal phosphate-dependent protein
MHDIVRPVLVADKDRCQTNIRRMKEKAAGAGALLRPHFKTHQSVTVGRWFREAGVDRITVSSVGMAEQFAGDGWDDILIAFPVNFRELRQINELASRVRLGLLVSCQESAFLLPGNVKHPADVWLKIDVGTHRTGFDPDDLPGFRQSLGRLLADPNLRVRGLLAHAGHTYQAASREDILTILAGGMGLLRDLRRACSDLVPDLSLSWGDTPSCSAGNDFGGAAELRPGNFVYYDTMQLELGVCRPEDLALTVAAPVVALHPQREEVVVYAGAVHLSKEAGRCREGRVHYGRVVFYGEDGRMHWPEEALYVRRVSQEHGIVHLPGSWMKSLTCGDLLGIVPVHACLAADLVRGLRVV